MRHGNGPRARVPGADGGGRAGRRPPGPGEGAGPPDALPGHGVPAADVPRAGPGRPGPLPAAHHAADRAGQRGRPRISGPGLGAAAAGAGHRRLPARHAACPAQDPAARADGAAGAGDRRLRAAPRQRLRDGAHRRRDRPARRRHSGPHRRRRGEVAAGSPRRRGRVPGRLRGLRRGRPPGTAGRGAGQRPLAPVAWPRRGRAEGSRRALRLLGEGHAPAGGQAGRDHPGTLAAGPRAALPGTSACWTAPAAWTCPSTRSSATPAPANRERLQRAPKYRPTLVDPYRDYLRKRRAEEPGVPVQQLLREIRELGYQGSSNLLVRYINQGRLDSDRPHLSPRRASPDPAHQAGPPHRRPARDARRAHQQPAPR